jgi:precorrin-6A/cobalt-precorrin-6A reductase
LIAVFSGTSDGKKVVESLIQKNHQVVCFNATKYGGSLYKKHDNLIVYDETMDLDVLFDKIRAYAITDIIDCTHPFAQVISKNLMEISKVDDINYIRYERPLDLKGTYNSYDEIIEELIETEGYILLTTGSNNLEVFTMSKLLSRLYCRVLPTVDVIKKCTDLGLTPKQIIGMQGPFEEAFNKATYDMLNIKHLVTKASGKAGGLKEKIDAAEKMNVQTYILSRPEVKYTTVYNDLNKLIKEF